MMGDRDIIIEVSADNDDDVAVGMNACVAAITKLSDLLVRHAEALEEREKSTGSRLPVTHTAPTGDGPSVVSQGD